MGGRVAVPLLLMVLSLAIGRPIATFGAETDAPKPIRFHRVLAPEDRMQDWPLGKSKYLPMEAIEFERLVDLMKMPGKKTLTVPAVVITSARYDAKLDGDRLTGSAAMEVAISGNQPASLSWEPCSLAVSAVRWSDREAKGGRIAREIALGLGPDGRLTATIPRSGTLNFEWSLGGRRNPDDSLGFLAETPAAVSNHWFLNVPRQRSIAVEQGIIVGSEEARDAAQRQWRVEMGGNNRCRVTLRPLDRPQPKRPSATAQESVTYDCSLRGLEVITQWKITAREEPLEQLEMLADPGLQITSARLGETPASWSASQNVEGKSLVVVRLPEPIRQSERVVRITTIGKPVWDHAWRLPRIVPRGLFWEEGTITLLLSEPLAVERMAALGCSKIGIDRLSPPRVGQSIQFQCFAPDSTVELVLSRRPARLTMMGATTINVDNQQATAEVAVEFSIDCEARTQLEATVAAGWNVDAVSFLTNEQSSRWAVEPQAAGGQRLSLRLPEPLTAAKPLRLRVRCRRAMGQGEKLTGEDFWPLRFLEATAGKRWTAIKTDECCRLTFNDSEKWLKRLAADDLSADESALLTDRDWQVLFECNDQTRLLEVRSVKRAAQYSANIAVDAIVGEGTLQERSRFRCSPLSSNVDRVVVQFSPRRSAAPNWTVDGRASEVRSVRRMGQMERSAAGEVSLETWEVVLARPRAEPFEIFAMRDTPVEGPPDTIALASMPEATEVQGTLTIRSPRAVRVRIENERLKQAGAELQASDSQEVIWGTYHYDPRQEVSGTASPAIQVWREGNSATTLGLVSLLDLQSWYPEGPSVRHLAKYQIQNLGMRFIRFNLPPEIDRDDLRAVNEDDQPAQWRLIAGESERYLIVNFRGERRMAQVSIEWTTNKPEMDFVGRCVPHWPEADLPYLARQWTVWFPSGYDIISPSFELIQAADAQGWRGWRTDVQSEARTAAEYVYEPPMHLLGIVIFFLTVALGCWRIRLPEGYREGTPPFLGVWALAILLVVFGIMAIVVPTAYLAMPAGGIVGIVFAYAWRTVFVGGWRAISSMPDVEPDASDPKSGSGTLTAILLLLTAILPILLGTATDLRGDDDSRQAKAATALGNEEYKVFVPIDGQRKPTGRIYVPEPFYQQLYRHSASLADERPGWQIAKADYRTEVIRDEKSKTAWRIDALRAQYALSVFHRNVRVRIPFDSPPTGSLPATASLDGQAVAVEWLPKIGAMVFDVAEPGDYRLELLLHPTVHHRDSSGGFEMPIPRVPVARLELVQPEGTPKIDVSSALGGIVPGDRASPLMADLGPTDRLSVRWAEDPAGDRPKPVVEADQLLWLKIRPGSVVVATKLNLRVTSGQLEELRIAVDPRLRLLPIEGEKAPAVQLVAETDKEHLLRVRWPKPISGQTTLEMAFLVSGLSGIGNVRMPRIELLDILPAKRWLAVSGDPSLKIDEQRKDYLESMPPGDFQAAWGKADATAHAAYRILDSGAELVMAARPDEPRMIVEQTLALGYDENHIELLLDARLTVSSGYAFEHRLIVPPGFQVKNISVLEHELEHVDRWVQNSDGTLTVFLNSATSGVQRILVRGRVPSQIAQKVSLPWMRIEKAELREATSEIYRRPAILIEFDKRPEEIQGESGKNRHLELGRLINVIRWDGQTPPAVTLSVMANRPAIRAKQAVWLRPGTRAWTTGISCSLSVISGLVDEFCVQTPSEWTGPYEVDQPGELRVHEPPGRGRCLLFRPQQAVASDYRFSITGSVEINRRKSVNVPEPRLLGCELLDRFVALPNRSEPERLAWQLAGLRPSTLPKDLTIKGLTEYDAYEVFDKKATAILPPTECRVSAKTVRAADVTALLQADGFWSGMATFDVIPDNSDTFLLSLPEGAELLQATVEGLPAHAVQSNEGTWQLHRASCRMPQRVEVFFRGARSAKSKTDGYRLDPPQLRDLPVQRYRWTVVPPTGWVISTEHGGTPVALSERGDAEPITTPLPQGRNVARYLGEGSAPLEICCRKEPSIEPLQYLAVATAIAGLCLIAHTALSRGSRE